VREVFFLGFRRLTKWSLLFSLARFLVREGRQRWGRLGADEQRELRRLVTTSKGRQSKLTAAEQAELKRLVRKASGKEAPAV
jgi:hypothetical protein